MRHLALTLPAPANRACVFAAHGGRSRETWSLLDGHFAIDRLARNRSQTPKSYDRTQFTQVAGIPQRVVEEAIGTRNRNEPHLTAWTGLERRSVVIQDPRRAKGKKRSRSGGVRSMLGAPRLVAGPNSKSNSAVIPRASRRCRGRRQFDQGEELAKSAKNLPLSATYLPLPKEPQEQKKSWRTGLYGDGIRSGRRGACFLGLDPMAEPRTAGSETRAERRRALDAMFTHRHFCASERRCGDGETVPIIPPT